MPPWAKTVTVGSLPDTPVDYNKTPNEPLTLTDSVSINFVPGSSTVFGGNFGGNF